jgi:hypothetical protein
LCIQLIKYAQKGKDSKKPPVLPIRIPIPELPPAKTGKPRAPSRMYIRTVIRLWRGGISTDKKNIANT